MATPPTGLDLNLQSTYGALLIGCFLSAAVWAVSLVQTFLYFMIYEKDSRTLKLMVLFLMAVDTANEILVLRSVWPALILHWGRPDVLFKSEGTLELIHHVWVAAIVAAGVQSYFTWRIYKLSGRNRLLPCFLIPLVAWQIVGLGPYNFLVFGHSAVSAGKQSQQLTAMAISLRATGAATDILIAAAMIYLLSRPGTQFKSTQNLVFRLIIMSVNSGAWTALLALLDLICIVAFPVDFTFIIFELPICSLYLSTLLFNLNARKLLRNGAQTSIDLSDLSGDRNNGNVSAPIHFVQPQVGSAWGTEYSSHESGTSANTKVNWTCPDNTDMRGQAVV